MNFAIPLQPAPNRPHELAGAYLIEGPLA